MKYMTPIVVLCGLYFFAMLFGGWLVMWLEMEFPYNWYVVVLLLIFGFFFHRLVVGKHHSKETQPSQESSSTLEPNVSMTMWPGSSDDKMGGSTHEKS